MIGGLSIAVVIPAYNEEGSLRSVVLSVKKVMEKHYAGMYTIIIINDASTDGTLSIAQDLEREHSTIKVFQNPKNYGKNKSLLYAFKKITTDILCFIDADGQYFAEDLPLLLGELESGADIVNGYRSMRNDSFYRKLMSFSFNSFNRLMFHIKVHDVNCGMKAFLKTKTVLCMPQYNKARWFFDTELLARAYNLHLQVKEVPIKHKHRENGESKVNCIVLALETVFYAFLLRFSLFFVKLDSEEHD